MTAFASQHPATMGIGRALVRRAPGDAVPVDIVQEFREQAMNVNGILRGSGKIARVNSYDEGSQFTLRVGGMPFAAIAVMTGLTLPAPTGTGANQVQTFYVPVNTAFPYFELLVRTFGDEGDCVDVYIPRAKLIKTREITLSDGNAFMQSPLEGHGVASPWGAGVELAAVYLHYETTPSTFVFPTPPT